MNLKKLISREIIITIVSVMLISITFFGVSYAIYLNIEEEDIGSLTFGEIVFDMCVDSSCAGSTTNIGNKISQEIYPMTVEEGLALDPYSFILKNNSEFSLRVYLYFAGASSEGFDYSKVNIAYKKSTDSQYTIAQHGNDEQLLAGYVDMSPSQEKIINVNIWGAEDLANDIIGKKFSGFLNVVAYYRPSDSSGLHTLVPVGTEEPIPFVTEYLYTGSYEKFIAPFDGWYQVELWGADGGESVYTAGARGGLGGYTKGKIELQEGDTFYVYVGGKGQTVTGTTVGTLIANDNGYNGGGYGGFYASNSTKGGGGGATDIRYFSSTPTNAELQWNSSLGLNSRIMVAGGGGGASSQTSFTSYSGNGGAGGGIVGGTADISAVTCHAYGIGGSQTGGGTSTTCTTGGTAYAGVASFGIGHTPYTSYDTNSAYVAGGGGGYYGGGGGRHAPAGGGSSFISGYGGSNAITSSASTTATNNTIHYSGKYFIDGEMTIGTNSNNGGKAIITYQGTTDPARTNTKLNNVRYIKDCVKGSTASTANQWSEIQAIYNGQNVAYGKTTTGTSPVNAGTGSGTYASITNGVVSGLTTDLAQATATAALHCVTVDLTQSYNLDEIGIWHYWADGRAYIYNTTYVSVDNTNWTEVQSSTDSETSVGKRISAYAKEKVSTILNGIRYIKDCINGSTGSTNNHWTEIQAISDYINVALGKTVTGTAAQNATYPYTRITDSDVTAVNYSKTDSVGLQCVTVNLAALYDVDKIKIWHYWGDERTYLYNKTYVSSDNTNWTTAADYAEVETSAGKTIDLYAKTKPTSVLNNTRYIKDCTNGNTTNAVNNWVELQVIKNNVNIAFGKTPTGTVAATATHLYTLVTNGDISYANYSEASANGLQCITIDLEQAYDLDQIRLWHYWGNTRTYNAHTLYASSDNTNWTTVSTKLFYNTIRGYTFSAY